jgi:hypothetical protein
VANKKENLYRGKTRLSPHLATNSDDRKYNLNVNLASRNCTGDFNELIALGDRICIVASLVKNRSEFSANKTPEKRNQG